MPRLFFQILIAALCVVALSVASITPTFAQEGECPGYRPGEPGAVLEEQMREVHQRGLQTDKENPRQQCTIKKLALKQEALLLWQRLAELHARTVGGAQCPTTARNAAIVQETKQVLQQLRKMVAECQIALGTESESKSSAANTTGASTPYPFDCKKRPIDANVAWYYTCNPAKESAGLKKAAYRHPITPQALYGNAWAECRTKPAEQQRACIDDAKLRVLLTEDSTIGKSCGALSGSAQVSCVDRYYLYGPDAGSQKNLRAHYQEVYDHQNRVEVALRKRLAEISEQLDKLSDDDPRWDKLSDLEQLYSDALSGKEPVPQDIVKLSQKTAPEPFTNAQQLFDRVVRASVDVAIDANKDKLSERDRKECAAAAYKAVWGVMSGDNEFKASEKCSAVVSDAVAQLAYQAAAQFSSNAPPEEDLLKHYLALRSPNTGGRNDGTLDAPFEAKGLTPETDVKNEGEQLLKERK